MKNKIVALLIALNIIALVPVTAATQPKVVLLGSSHMARLARFVPDSYSVVARGGLKLIDLTEGPAETNGYIQQVKDICGDTHCNVVVWLGGNDMATDASLKQVKERALEVIDRLEGYNVYFITMIRRFWNPGDRRWEWRMKYNKFLRRQDINIIHFGDLVHKRMYIDGVHLFYGKYRDIALPAIIAQAGS